MNINEIVGNNIATRRKQRGLMAKELAETLDISPQQLNKYERGVNRIPLEYVWKLAQIFRVRIDKLCKIDK